MATDLEKEQADIIKAFEKLLKDKDDSIELYDAKVKRLQDPANIIRQAGYDEGYSAGYQTGYQTGYGVINQAGYDEGYREGYQTGVEVGVRTQSTLSRESKER